MEYYAAMNKALVVADSGQFAELVFIEALMTRENLRTKFISTKSSVVDEGL